ncbi:hypothetical protein cyc_05190 [Cyclospora cayetanensis]|uniref:Transmembrane protein n=1 Tax=Cyclospora cayetanensis TaxID=88456 RepID=A0A1D3CVT3_9EIME|nr:hypothetical protein cyc_05190 [Cyclospora cayetanensis]
MLEGPLEQISPTRELLGEGPLCTLGMSLGRDREDAAKAELFTLCIRPTTGPSDMRSPTTRMGAKHHTTSHEDDDGSIPSYVLLPLASEVSNVAAPAVQAEAAREGGDTASQPCGISMLVTPPTTLPAAVGSSTAEVETAAGDRGSSCLCLLMVFLICTSLLFYADRGIIPGASEEVAVLIRNALGTDTPSVYVGLLQSAFVLCLSVSAPLCSLLHEKWPPFLLLFYGLGLQQQQRERVDVLGLELIGTTTPLPENGAEREGLQEEAPSQQGACRIDSDGQGFRDQMRILLSSMPFGCLCCAYAIYAAVLQGAGTFLPSISLGTLLGGWLAEALEKSAVSDSLVSLCEAARRVPEPAIAAGITETTGASTSVAAPGHFPAATQSTAPSSLKDSITLATHFAVEQQEHQQHYKEQPETPHDQPQGRSVGVAGSQKVLLHGENGTDTAEGRHSIPDISNEARVEPAAKDCTSLGSHDADFAFYTEEHRRLRWLCKLCGGAGITTAAALVFLVAACYFVCLFLAIVHSVPPQSRYFANAICICCMHAFGDVPSPFFFGWLKDMLAPACSQLDPEAPPEVSALSLYQLLLQSDEEADKVGQNQHKELRHHKDQLHQVHSPQLYNRQQQVPPYSSQVVADRQLIHQNQRHQQEQQQIVNRRVSARQQHADEEKQRAHRMREAASAAEARKVQAGAASATAAACTPISTKRGISGVTLRRQLQRQHGDSWSSYAHLGDLSQSDALSGMQNEAAARTLEALPGATNTLPAATKTSATSPASATAAATEGIIESQSSAVSPIPRRSPQNHTQQVQQADSHQQQQDGNYEQERDSEQSGSEDDWELQQLQRQHRLLLQRLALLQQQKTLLAARASTNWIQGGSNIPAANAVGDAPPAAHAPLAEAADMRTPATDAVNSSLADHTEAAFPSEVLSSGAVAAVESKTSAEPARNPSTVDGTTMAITADAAAAAGEDVDKRSLASCLRGSPDDKWQQLRLHARVMHTCKKTTAVRFASNSSRNSADWRIPSAHSVSASSTSSRPATTPAVAGVAKSVEVVNTVAPSPQRQQQVQQQGREKSRLVKAQGGHQEKGTVHQQCLQKPGYSGRPLKGKQNQAMQQQHANNVCAAADALIEEFVASA